MYAIRSYYVCANDAPGVLALGRGMPDISAPTLKPLHKALSSGRRALGQDGLAYDSLRGSPELRHQVARLAIDSGCRLHPDDIITTTGCQEALSISMRAVTRPGGVVAVVITSYSIHYTKLYDSGSCWTSRA